MKTSKLEDQYTKLFNLAFWPEEPHEIHFFETNVGIPDSTKMVGGKELFARISETYFPALGTLRLAIWTTDFLFVSIMFDRKK